MQIKTIKLQELVSKALKGVGNNKLLPLTSLMAIKCEGGKIQLITTDGTNYLYLTDDLDSDDFYVTVEVDTFAKLVARLTNEYTSLDVADGVLTIVSGKGTYSIALPLDEDGTVIKYPNPVGDKVDSGTKIGTISRGVIDTILTSLKPSLALTMERPCYTGYYLGDIAIATDTEQISSLDMTLVSTPQLINPEMMNLLDVVADDAVDVYVNGNDVIFVSPKVLIFGSTLQGIESYAVDAIKGLVVTEFPCSCKLPKAELLQLLERIALFVDVFDEGTITLNFTQEGLVVTNKQSSGVDLIPYVSTENFKDYVCDIDVNVLRNHIKAYNGDVLTLCFGDTKSIKLVSDNLTVIIALLAA